MRASARATRCPDRTHAVSAETWADIGPHRWIARHFSWLCAALCLAYLVVELVYVRHLPLVMDEFAGALQVHRLREGIPYRDYMPYKTVLGYALQLPWLMLSDDPFRALLWVKAAMAAYVSLGVFLVAHRLRAFFLPEAVLLGTLLLFCHSTFLERSAELRVDMLTALVGLLSLEALLAGRFRVAALVAGVSLLVSQKGAYYVVPGALCLLLRVAVVERNRAGLRRLLESGVLAALPLVVYWLGFGWLAGFDAVFGRVAVSPKAIAFTPMYDVRDYWWQTLGRNPGFYGLAVVAWGALLLRCFRRGPSSHWVSPVLVLYAGTLAAACAWHKQPWPYFFVLLLPTLAVVIIAGLDWALRLPVASSRPAARWAYATACGSVFWLGCWGPLQRVPRVLERDSDFQRRTLAAAYALLGDEGSYFAGTQLLYDRRHVPGTSWLDKRRLAQITVDPSLALSPLRREPPRLLIYSYRMRSLPAGVREWLGQRYHNVAGNLFARVVAVEPGQSVISVPYTAHYRLLDGRLTLGGWEYQPGQTIHLEKSDLAVVCEQPARLVVWSHDNAFQRYLGSEPQAFFYNVYRY